LNDNNIVKNYKKYSKEDSQDINISKDEDNNDLDLTLFWKDFIRAMRRSNTED